MLRPRSGSRSCLRAAPIRPPLPPCSHTLLSLHSAACLAPLDAQMAFFRVICASSSCWPGWGHHQGSCLWSPSPEALCDSCTLGPAWGWNRALIHPVSLGDKRASPPCPAEAARGDDMGRPCSLDDLLQQRWGSPQTPRPTRVNLPAGPRRSCPPLSSSHFS